MALTFAVITQITVLQHHLLFFYYNATGGSIWLTSAGSLIKYIETRLGHLCRLIVTFATQQKKTLCTTSRERGRSRDRWSSGTSMKRNKQKRHKRDLPRPPPSSKRNMTLPEKEALKGNKTAERVLPAASGESVLLCRL